MFRQPDSLIVVTSQTFAAAVVLRGEVVSFAHRLREPGTDLIAATESALELLDRRTSRVWLLTTDVWSQPITMAADVARRVPRDRLAQFACFEVEPLSGISPSQAIAALVPLEIPGTDPGYWVVETDRNVFEQIDGIITSRGGRLQSVMHPAGCPRAITESSGAWRRLEVWNDLIVCLVGLSNGRVDRQVITRDVVSDAWQVEAEQWFAERGDVRHSEILQAADVYLANPQPRLYTTEISLTEIETLERWSRGWAAALTRSIDVPQIAPGSKPMTARSKQFVGLGAAAAILLFGVSGYTTLGAINQRAVAQTQEETATANEPIQAAKQLSAATAKSKAELENLEKRQTTLAAEIAKYRVSANQQKSRIYALLDELAEACDGEILIDRLESNGREMHIFGKCLDARQANHVAMALHERLTPLGLKLSVPNKLAQYKLRDGSPHSFEFVVRDAASNEQGSGPTPP